MKAKLLTASIASLAVAMLLAGSARASLISGWDFSQYLYEGQLIADTENYANTLVANYSDLDPTFGAGAESAVFGSMYLNGAYGSTNTPLNGTSDPFIPTDLSLISNLTAPGTVQFDAHVELGSEGQLATVFRSMTSTGPSVVAFGADLSSVPEQGQDWILTFGAKTFTGIASVGIEFSSNGFDFVSVGTANVTSNDSLFTFALGAAASDTGIVRLTFGAVGSGGLNQPIIDNVAISATLVPEPAVLVLLVAGLAGVSALRGRRA